MQKMIKDNNGVNLAGKQQSALSMFSNPFAPQANYNGMGGMMGQGQNMGGFNMANMGIGMNMNVCLLFLSPEKFISYQTCPEFTDIKFNLNKMLVYLISRLSQEKKTFLMTFLKSFLILSFHSLTRITFEAYYVKFIN